MLPEKVEYVVYHDPCLDGLAAALCAFRFSEQIKFIPHNHSNPQGSESAVLGLQRSNILYVDCVPTKRVLHLLRENGNEVQILDHHVGNQRDLEGEHGCHFDMEHSGCDLAWEFFFPGKDFPFLLWCIAERDLGRFDDPTVRYVGHALMDMSRRTIEDLNGWLEKGLDGVRELMQKGKELEDTLDELKRTLVINPVTLPDLEYKVVAARLDGYKFINEICQHMYTVHPEVDLVLVYYELENGDLKVSFRTNKDGVDLSVIAKMYGGNGHAKAAGATVSKALW
jgi:oligoribonuclease NrnB/cAMP/cGMP phosphodiesterase (DHH superfamily)